MAELADAPDLGSGAERRAGSTPVPGTNRSPLASSMKDDQTLDFLRSHFSGKSISLNIFRPSLYH